MKEELTVQPVGKVFKTFGTNGEVLIKISSDLQEKEPLFIEIDELLVPFFIKSATDRGGKLIVVFSHMETETLATELVGKLIYQEEVDEEESEPGEFDFLISFAVEDKELGKLGIVTDFYNYPSNPCLEIEYKKERVLIPINNEFIKQVDMDNKVIYTELPSGIFDLS